MVRKEGNRLIREFDGEKLWIESWGKNALRVRATGLAAIDESRDWALLPAATAAATPAGAAAAAGAGAGAAAAECKIEIAGERATIANGGITASLRNGRLSFFNKAGEPLLKERWLNRDEGNEFYSAINLGGREFRPILGGNHRLTVRFAAAPDEKIFGMGQYQDGNLDLKGCVLELAHKNSQASVPFLISNKGYGLLWNNPAIGRVSFAKNVTEWTAESTPQLDYWIVAGDAPAEIEESYAAATGTVPMMPDYAMGFWQCKLRYKTQDELLSVAREYKKRDLPLSVIVSDFFHWPMQGEWKFDPKYWPDPDAMVSELKSMGVELMVSVWPTVDKRSENFKEMLEHGYLVRAERGVRTTMDFMGNTVFFDPTHPGARDFVWKAAKRNYYDKGIKIFWLDEAEPEYSVYDYDNYRYHLGTDLEVGNIYPVMYAKTFYDGMEKAGQKNILNLLRCAWAGSQRYGALVWSGDIDATFESLRTQFAAGLNMAIAGIPWWTTDIGGFGGGDPDDPAYRECLIRWFQYGAFCPVFRLHGFRVAKDPGFKLIHDDGSDSDAVFSGGPNEVWSYGEEAYGILSRYLFLRERLKPYIARLMREAHERGTPPMRPLFYDFPKDGTAWEIEDEYMFGSDLLVAPVMKAGERERRVYLPEGARWTEVWTGTSYGGGTTTTVAAPLDRIPLFAKDDAVLPILE
ncbi:MAG: family 31 glucosidase [Treponema sp. GWB1_62_6]|nr:MAG: family 31 glucosidase [Treponema sp. GWB1_62_6]